MNRTMQDLLDGYFASSQKELCDCSLKINEKIIVSLTASHRMKRMKATNWN
jgi:hypothetical protein